MYLNMEGQELVKAPLTGSEPDEQALLSMNAGSNQLDGVVGGALSPEDIFPTEKDPTVVDVNSWERDSSTLPSLQRCSTMSEGTDELLRNYEVATAEAEVLGEGTYQRDGEDVNDVVPSPPLFRSTSSGLSVLLHWTTAGFVSAKQQQETRPSINSSVQPTAPMDTTSGHFSYQDTGYQQSLPFQPHQGAIEGLSRKQTMQDLLQAQRAIYFDSLRNLPGSRPRTATTSHADMKLTPRPREEPESIVFGPSRFLPSTTTEEASLPQPKKKPRKNHSKSSTTVRKLKLGRQRLRPMSAYNIFFKEERARIVGAPLEDDTAAPTTWDVKRRRRKSPHNKIGFSNLGKLIGQRWKELNAEERAVYEDKAREDKVRYEAEKAAAAATSRQQTEMETEDYE